MGRYVKENPRITVSLVDSDTEEVLGEFYRNWTNIGEVFSDNTANSIIKNTIGDDSRHKNIIIMAVAEYHKNE